MHGIPVPSSSLGVAHLVGIRSSSCVGGASSSTSLGSSCRRIGSASFHTIGRRHACFFVLVPANKKKCCWRVTLFTVPCPLLPRLLYLQKSGRRIKKSRMPRKRDPQAIRTRPCSGRCSIFRAHRQQQQRIPTAEPKIPSRDRGALRSKPPLDRSFSSNSWNESRDAVPPMPKSTHGGET